MEHPVHLEHQEFAALGTYRQLRCQGRCCAECGRCRDWYYTGDVAIWNWIQNSKNWTDHDWQRYKSNHVYERFQRRDGATCYDIIFNHHIFNTYGFHGDAFSCLCLCADNRRVT